MERFIEPVFFILILQSLTISIFLFVFQSIPVFQPSILLIFQFYNLSTFQFLFKVEREGDNLAACLLGSIGIHIALGGVWQETVFMSFVETICQTITEFQFRTQLKNGR